MVLLTVPSVVFVNNLLSVPAPGLYVSHARVCVCVAARSWLEFIMCIHVRMHEFRFEADSEAAHGAHASYEQSSTLDATPQQLLTFDGDGC